ncbi:MAG: gamma-glutamylcyclotransferase, partial [Proteobacteria bacterium]|nr:gamma-glutamylcyclotransferase [Pseudomonadota bacterium]
MELPDSKVYGLLFEINEAYDIETIRKKEGYPNYYEEIQVTVKCEDKDISNVKTYKVVKGTREISHQKPTTYYMELILKNARINEFPAEYIRCL